MGSLLYPEYMTRLACFYRTLDPRTEASLKKYAPQAGLEVEWVETPDSGTGYAEELEKRWTGEGDLLLVEEDKEVFPQMLNHMIGCRELWCGYTYWILPEPDTSLALAGFGVTRFSARLQKLVKVSWFAGEQQAGIDRRLLEYLMEHHGTKMHIHGHTTHHHVYTPAPAAYRERVAELRAQGMIPPAMAPAAPDPGLLPGSYRLPTLFSSM